MSPTTPLAPPLPAASRGTLAAVFSQARANTAAPQGPTKGVPTTVEGSPKPPACKFAQFATFAAKRQLTPDQRESVKKPRLGDFMRDE